MQADAQRGILGDGHEGYELLDQDRINFASFNHILWVGLMGNTPYPAAPTGMDLRQNRPELLASHQESLQATCN